MHRLYFQNPSSRAWVALGLLLLSFAAACGLVQRSRKAKENTQFDTTQLQEVSAETALEASKVSTTQELHFEDSSGSYQIEIWPKGKFNFQPGQGFEAEAERVRITGQQSRLAGGLKQYTEAAAQRQSERLQSRDEKGQSLSQQRMQQERNPAWGWALILLVVLLIFERFFTKSRYPFVP